MAVPMTWRGAAVSDEETGLGRTAYFGNIGGNDGRLCEEPEEVVEPGGAVRLDVLGEVHAGDGAKLDAESLQEDGDDVGEKNHDEQLVLVGCAGRDVSRIITCSFPTSVDAMHGRNTMQSYQDRCRRRQP